MFTLVNGKWLIVNGELNADTRILLATIYHSLITICS